MSDSESVASCSHSSEIVDSPETLKTTDTVFVVPRRKRNDPPSDGHRKAAIALTPKQIIKLYTMQQREAADFLVRSVSRRDYVDLTLGQGISLTALKVACRRMGLPKWPYIRKANAKGSNTSDDESARTPGSDAESSSVVSERLWWPIDSLQEHKLAFRDQEILERSLTSWGLSSVGQALWMDEALKHCEV